MRNDWSKIMWSRVSHSAGWVVLVFCYGAYMIPWHKKEQFVVLVCRAAPVSSTVLALPAATYRHYRRTYCIGKQRWSWSTWSRGQGAELCVTYYTHPYPAFTRNSTKASPRDKAENAHQLSEEGSSVAVDSHHRWVYTPRPIVRDVLGRTCRGHEMCS